MSTKKPGASPPKSTPPPEEAQTTGQPATDDKAESAPKTESAPIDELFGINRSQATDEQIQDIVHRHIVHLTKNDPLLTRYNLLVLYDGTSVDRSDADRIYQALAAADRAKPILLVLRSPGGDIAAAYFIGKLCREHTTVGFEVAVPREAKSAATLICCGADRIHMGSLSELGPIDPQLGGMPALAVKHSLEHLAQLVSQNPGAKEMLSDYLSKALPFSILGHFERVAGSAAQYAERLLSLRVDGLGTPAGNTEIARRLVYEYKDHGFAIDAREATSIFGDGVVKVNSEEYRVANQIYEALDLVEFILDRAFRRDFSFTGGVSSGCRVILRRETAKSG